MLKEIKFDKSRITMLAVIFVASLIKLLIPVIRMGRPSLWIIAVCALICVFFVIFFFLKFPTEIKDMFTGQNMVCIVAALVVLILAFGRGYLSADFLVTLAVMFAMMIMSSDLRLLPVNVALSVISTVALSNTGVVAIPAVMCVSIITAAPLLKKAESWKKYTFYASQAIMLIDLIYVICRRRFSINISNLRGHIIFSVILMAFAIFFVALAVLTLNQKRAIMLQAVGYIIPACVAVACSFMDKSYVLCITVSMLMALVLLCGQETQAKAVTDKAAAAIGEVIMKLIAEKNKE